MIKLSSLLEHILDHPMKGEAIQEAKRLERIDECSRLTHTEIASDVSNTELKPLLGDFTQHPLCVLLADHRTSFLESSSSPTKVQGWIDNGWRVAQVMQPDANGNCPTQCVYTPEREHEWVIYNANGRFESRWFAMAARGSEYWASELTNKDAQRFDTATEAQDYITTHNITNAFPWPVPKLSEKWKSKNNLITI